MRIITTTDGILHTITSVGLIVDVFDESRINKLLRRLITCHVRYSTTGSYMLKNVQPFVVDYKFSSLSVVCNRNLVKY